LYWVVELPGAGNACELRSVGLASDARSVLVASERKITNFALDEAFLYVTRSLSLSYEVMLIPISSISEKYHFGTHIEITHPEIVGELLWFYDPSKKQVRSVDLGLNDFLRSRR